MEKIDKVNLSNKQKKYYNYFLKELNLICLSLNENNKMNFKVSNIENKVQNFLIDIFIYFCYGKNASINSEPIFTFDINKIETKEQMNYYKFRNEINVTLIYCYCHYNFSFDIIIPILKQSISNSNYLDIFGEYYNKILVFLKKKYFWDDLTYLINYFTYFNPKEFLNISNLIKHTILFEDNEYINFFNNEFMVNIYNKLYCDSFKFFLFLFELYLNKNIIIKMKKYFLIKLKLFKEKNLLNYFDKTRKELNEKELNFNILYSQFHNEINQLKKQIKNVKIEKQVKFDKRLTFIQNEIMSIQKYKNELFSIFFSNNKSSQLKSNTI